MMKIFTGDFVSEEEYKKLKHGDLVEFEDIGTHQKRKGKVVMRSSSLIDAWVGNTGGQYGTPAIVDRRNFIGVRRHTRRIR